MTLHQIMTFGCILGLIITPILLLTWLGVRAIYTLKDDEITKDLAAFSDTCTITVTNPRIAKAKKTCARLKTISNILIYMSMSILGAALCCLLLFCFYRHMAVQHGAFDDFTKTETIRTIKDRSEHMFIDESDNLPDDLSGSILIFFKFTCDDCYDTHDQIMAVLEQKQVTNVHFISTASERGAELVSQFEVEAVPWGVYVAEDETIGITDILYDEFETEANQKFIEENLMKLIQAQKGDTDK